MPELPEVEIIRRNLDSFLVGATISAITIRRMEIVRNADRKTVERLEGQIVKGVQRSGKLLIIELSSSWRLIFHLKMTGNLIACPTGKPGKHCHLIISGLTKDGGEFNLYFNDIRRFGYCYVQRGAEDPAGLFTDRLGPDALDIAPEDLVTIVTSSRQRIKALFLDQTRIAGLGNIYTDEILYESGIHPMTPSKDLPREEILRLHKIMVRVLGTAIERGGSSIRDFVNLSGMKGSFQMEHAVYRRQGMSCAHCEDTITRIVVAGRGTYVCPTCQHYPISTGNHPTTHKRRNKPHEENL